MSKSILVDAIHLLSPRTGIGRYTFENCKRLESIAPDKRWYYDYGYHISDKLLDTSNKGDTGKAFDLAHKFKSSVTKYSSIKSSVKMLIKIKHLLSTKNYDLYWQPNFNSSNSINARKVVTTVHDFSFLVHPDWHPVYRVKNLNKNVFIGIEKSDYIITGSNFIKDEVIKYSGCNPDKIFVIYHGVDHEVFKVYPEEELEGFKRLYKLPDRFILFVGSIEPRKNLLNLLRAYKEYVNSNEETMPLLLVGFRGWQNEEIMKMIDSLNDKVQYIGYLNNKELAYIYNLATIFIYPSLYEGFGIPPLEAMACGTPVITSNVTSIPEICGDAALYVDPYDLLEIKKAIELLAIQVEIRKELVAKGLVRSLNFSWEYSAQRHLELFERVMNQ